MSAERFIDLLESNGLLDDTVIAGLRRQISDGKKRATAESVARALVEKGHLTKFQATKLVGDATSGEEGAGGTSSRKPEDSEDLGLAPDDSDDLGLAPDDELDEKDENEESDDDDQVVMLEDAGPAGESHGGLTPVEDAAGGLTPVGGTRPSAQAEGLTALEPSDGLDALGDAAHGAGADAHDPFAAPQSQPGRRGRPSNKLPRGQARKTRWDTKLMLGGATVLILLVIFGVMLAINLLKAPAVEMWDAAMEDYRSEAYSQASAKFEKFLDSYPDDENASEAHVRIAFCKIRVVLSDPQKGLERAKELLPTVESESGFRICRSELATMLIQIPQGFIEKAKLSGDMEQKEKLTDLAEQGLNDLVENSAYVPTSSREAINSDIQEVTEDINRVRRDVNRDKDLRKAIEEIEGLVQANDTVGAFDTFKSLVKTYPGLERDPDLIQAVLQVTEREAGLVEVSDTVTESVQAEDPAESDHLRVVLFTRTGEGASRLEGRVAPVLAAGSVYGLDAASGKVLWDRFVGGGTQFHPVAISTRPDSDVLLVDGQEVVRVNAATGDLVWRLPAGESVHGPVVAGDKLYVPAVSGRLLEVDSETGNSARFVNIPQPLGASPGVSASQPYLFQPGEHSNLYALSSQDLTCEHVYYIGHKPGAVSVAPVALMGHVFVAENAGADYCNLHVLSVNPDSEQGLLQKAQEPIRLKGNVTVPMVEYGNRLMVVTDLAEVSVFNININAEENPVEVAAKKAASPDDPMAAYPLADAGTLWLANDRLSKFRIQVTTKEINLLENTNAGDACVAPLQLHGDVLVFARRRRDSTGVTIAAVSIDRPRHELWETRVGVPAGRVQVDPETNEITVISAAASLFAIDRQAISTGYSDQPIATATTAAALSFTDAVEFGDGRVAFFNPASHSQVLFYDPSQASARSRLKVVDLKLEDAAVTCTPVALAGGLLTPMDRGEIRLLRLPEGDAQVLPFQPRLEPGETIQWSGPGVLEGGNEFVVANNRREVYRVGIKEGAEAHLSELAKAQLEVQIASQLATVGDTVYGVVHSSGGDVLVALNAGDLQVAKEFDLTGARVTWGPTRVGDAVLIVTDADKVRCYGSGQQERWENAAPAHGQPAGRPLVAGDDFIFAATNGAVWRLAGATGDELGKTKLGEPLGAGPVAFGNRLLLCGNDGALHVIPMVSSGS